MNYASTLSDEIRRKARVHAYLSTWYGCISEVMIDSSAILLLYISVVGGSETQAMLSTSVSGIALMLFLIPCAPLADLVGLKKMASLGCYLGCAGYLLMALAPCFPDQTEPRVILLGCLLYGISRPIHLTAWYPLLDGFLLPGERGPFFGFMRFSYMVLTSLLFFALGLVMGSTPPVWLLQLITVITAILLLGRKYYIDKFPGDVKRAEKFELRKAFLEILKNQRLLAFSIYICCVTAAYGPVVPLTLIYLKNQLQLGAGTVQLISTFSLIGSIAGFLLYGRMLRFFGLRFLHVAVHLVFIAVPFSLFMLSQERAGLSLIIAVILFICSFSNACYLCSYSTVMLDLIQAGYKTMGTALCGTYHSIGGAAGRTATAVLLSGNYLAATCPRDLGTGSKYHLFFASYAALALFFLILLPLLPAFHSGKKAV